MPGLLTQENHVMPQQKLEIISCQASTTFKAVRTEAYVELGLLFIVNSCIVALVFIIISKWIQRLIIIYGHLFLDWVVGIVLYKGPLCRGRWWSILAFRHWSCFCLYQRTRGTFRYSSILIISFPKWGTSWRFWWTKCWVSRQYYANWIFPNKMDVM